ncbi:hypothetical protein RQP46_004940 [Phenoliferia psychrophenolica]
MSLSSYTRATAEQLSAISAFSSCEISDALLKLKVAHGGHIPDLEVQSLGAGEDGRIVGEAYTVKMVDQKDKDAPKLAGHFIDLAPSGSIMVISSPPHVKSASLGGLLALSASTRGVKGVVIDGRCRDLSEIRSLQLPVFSRGHTTLGQSPFTRPSEVQVPITIHPVHASGTDEADKFPSATVNPFDVIVADIDGVVVIEPSLIAQVVELATLGKAIDEKCRADLAMGRGVKQTFAEHRGK